MNTDTAINACQGGPEPRKARHSATAALGCLALLAAVILAATPTGSAASIPAWLDDAISEWNDENTATPMRFVDSKDSFVWYMIQDTPEVGHKEIRASVYELVEENDYKVTSEEELVTTGKPPSPVAPYKDKKCWTRSFVLDIEELSNTKAAAGRGGERPGQRQRMLTSQVCEDEQLWFVGVRILQ